MGKSIEHLNTMLDEYGSLDWQVVTDDSLLVDKVRRQAEKAFANLTDNEGFYLYEETFDTYLRRRYAYAAANSLGIKEQPLLSVFVALRMERVWHLTEKEAIDDLAPLVKLLELGPHWGMSAQSIAKLGKIGFTSDQIVEVVGVWERAFSGNLNKATYPHNYRNGVHVGDAIKEAAKRVNRGHLKMYRTFLSTLKVTAAISTSPVPSRYLQILKRLDHDKRSMVLTDKRNWLPQQYGSLYFRLNVIPSCPKEWQPVRNNLFRVKEWLSSAMGRVPLRDDIKELPFELIRSFTRKTFTEFIKAVKEFNAEGHEVVALARLIVGFGKGVWRTYVQKCLGDVTPSSIHDAGINLPGSLTPEQVKFLFRYAHKMGSSQKVVNCWEFLIDEGVKPLEKGGLAEAEAIMRAYVYENIKHKSFAKEAAKHGIRQAKFEELQELWLTGLKNLRMETIPKVVISDGDYKFYRLDKDDPRGIFLGHYTGCCQHPEGEGAECAEHGHCSEDGAFCVLEHRGEIKFQSWVWRIGNSIVFDNIEGHGRAKPGDDATRIYMAGVNAFVGRFGIERVFIGAGGSDMRPSYETISNPLPLPKGYHGYSDSEFIFLMEAS